MSKRTEQVASLLQTSINEIIIKDFEPPLGTLVSISQVTISPDLKNATIFVSVIPANRLGSGFQAIKKFGGHIQRQIRQKMQMKIVPQLHWELDERALKYDRIEEALKQ